MTSEFPDDLNETTANDAPQNSPTHGDESAGYFSSRSAAALARARIAKALDIHEILAGEGGAALPVWEREYLLGLSLLAMEEPEEAAAHLQRAFQAAPGQGSVAIALAGLTAPQRPEEALTILAAAQPSREVMISRAAILFRCRRYNEARTCLDAACAPEIPGEPPHLFQASARAHCHLQEKALATALCERQGLWSQAALAWGSAGASSELPTTLLKAREYYQAVSELQTLSPHQSWRRSQLKEKVTRLHHELGRGVLNREPLFYFSAANCADNPAEAVKGFKRLLRQRTWTEAQQRVGGERLVFAGDMLLRHGEAAEARHAYRLAHAAGHVNVAERLAVARAVSDDKAELSSLSARTKLMPLRYKAELSSLSARTKLMPLRYKDHFEASQKPNEPDGSWYPPLVAAVRLTACGRKEEAAVSLAEAVTRQAPPALCCLLENSIQGTLPSAILTEEELQALHLPSTIRSVVQLLAGPESWEERIDKYAKEKGKEWPACCPVQPVAVAAALVWKKCREGEWSEALATADQMVSTGDPSLADIALLVRLVHALGLAGSGEMAMAEECLRTAEACFTGS